MNFSDDSWIPSSAYYSAVVCIKLFNIYQLGLGFKCSKISLIIHAVMSSKI